jgi:heme A synthase
MVAEEGAWFHFLGSWTDRRRFLAEAVVEEEEEEALAALLLRVVGVDGIVGSSVLNSGANSGPTLAPRELALVVTTIFVVVYLSTLTCLWEKKELKKKKSG